MNEPIFKTYKEKQAYYADKYKNRGEILHVSIVLGKDGKSKTKGKTYTSDRGEERRFKRMAKLEKRNK